MIQDPNPLRTSLRNQPPSDDTNQTPTKARQKQQGTETISIKNPTEQAEETTPKFDHVGTSHQ